MKRSVRCVLIALVASFSPLSSVPQAAHAQNTNPDYWILGAYRVRSNAEAEQARLSRALDRAVFLYRVDNYDVWRVSVSTEGLDEAVIRELGINYWRTELDIDGIESLPSFRRYGEAPLAPSADAWLRDDETIIEWCERMNARAVGELKCNKQDLDRLRLLAETVEAQSQLLEARCALADTRAERRICEAWQQERLIQ